MFATLLLACQLKDCRNGQDKKDEEALAAEMIYNKVGRTQRSLISYHQLQNQ